MNWQKEFPKERFTQLLSSGKTETQALKLINEEREMLELKPFHEAVVVQIQVKEPEFKEKVEEAKKLRADVWFEKIAEASEKTIFKDEVPAEKLKFEQRKYMAAIDNPEKYSEKVNHKVDVAVNIFQEMKSLPTREVQKLLKEADPFANAIEAEFEDIGESHDEES